MDPLLDKLKQVIISSQTSLNHQVSTPQSQQQQFVQFYPNQTQYIINLHNHINSQPPQQRVASSTNRQKSRKQSIKHNTTVNVTDNSKRSVSKRKSSKPGATTHRYQDDQYQGLAMPPKVKPTLQSSVEHLQNPKGGPNFAITSRIKTHRQENLNQKSSKFNSQGLDLRSFSNNQQTPQSFQSLNSPKRGSKYGKSPANHFKSQQREPKVQLNTSIERPTFNKEQFNIGGPKLYINSSIQKNMPPKKQSQPDDSAEYNQSSYVSHLEQYKNIPLKNYGAASGNKNAYGQQRANHQKYLSNNFIQQQTFSNLSGATSEVEHFKAIPVRTKSRIKKKSTQTNRDSSINSSQNNHFKTSKKQSLQTYGGHSGSLIHNGKLVSNVASISQKIPFNLGGIQTSGQGTISLSGLNQTPTGTSQNHSLKSRYGRGKSSKSKIEKNATSTRYVSNYSRSINNLNSVTITNRSHNTHLMTMQDGDTRNKKITSNSLSTERMNKDQRKSNNKIKVSQSKSKGSKHSSGNRQGISQLYQFHNNKTSNMNNFQTLNITKFRSNNNDGNSSRIGKNLSPISILDNSQQLQSHLIFPYTQSNIKSPDIDFRVQTQQQNPQNILSVGGQKQNSQIIKKTQNLTEQIRKVNKIQIKKRFLESFQSTEKSLFEEAEQLLKEGQRKKAISKFLELIKIQPLNIEAHFQLALLYKHECPEEAVLHFEQVIKHDIKTKEIAPKALFEIVRIHIKSRNFYQASYELDRANHFGFESQKLKDYKKFVQAVLLLMKRKMKMANEIFDSLLQSKIKLELKYLINIYRAYGLINTKQYQIAEKSLIEAFQISNENQEIDQSLLNISNFNLKLCKMLKLEAGKNKLRDIISIKKEFPDNRDIIRYHAVYLIQQQLNQEVDNYTPHRREIIDQEFRRKANRSIGMTQSAKFIGAKDIESSQNESKMSLENNKVEYQRIATANTDNKLKLRVVDQALQILNEGVIKSPKDRNLLLTRSYIQFYRHNFLEALCDIDAVIEIERASSGEEEPNATDLLHKGRCHACLSMFKEAIADFTRVIELDDELFDAYFFRGKCSYLIGDTSQAFLDFQKLILLQPKNPMVHSYAGNLLMTTGSYEDATKAFTNADSVQSCPFAIYQRSRCYLALGDIKRAMKDLNQCCQMYQQRNKENALVSRDARCLEVILNSLEFLSELSSEKKIFDEEDAESKPAQENFMILTERLSLLIERDDIELRELQQNKKDHDFINSESRMQQQLIPNVNKIKLEKVRAIRRMKAKKQVERIPKQKRTKSQAEMLLTAYTTFDEQDEELKEAGSQISPWSFYMENLFSKDDVYLYRAVIHFYQGEFQKAIEDYKNSSKTKKIFKQWENETQDDSQSDSGMSSFDASHEDDQASSDEPKIRQEHDKGSQSSDETDLSDVGLCSLNKNEMLFNVMLCLLKQGNEVMALKYLRKLIRNCPQKYTDDLLKMKEIIKNGPKHDDKLAIIEPFKTSHRLCRFFPLVQFKGFFSRPSFSFPFVKPPNMIPNVDETLLVNEYGQGSKEENYLPQPLALWIKQIPHYQFTDTIINPSESFQSQTSYSQKSNTLAKNKMHLDFEEELKQINDQFDVSLPRDGGDMRVESSCTSVILMQSKKDMKTIKESLKSFKKFIIDE